MISLLINTKNRYESLEKILQSQCEYSIIDEIIVFNNGSQELSQHPKLKVLKGTWDIGLRSRWILGLLAKNTCIAYQDDDIIIPESLFKILYGHFLFDSSRVYGIFGRKIDLIFNTYDPNIIYAGDVDIVLTRFAMTNKHLIPYVIEAEEKIIPYRYPTASEFPHDDILLSYCCKSVYNKPPFVVKCKEIEEAQELEVSKSGLHSQQDFLNRRKNIIEKCRSILCYERIQDIQPATSD